jgi:hypothetical protein
MELLLVNLHTRTEPVEQRRSGQGRGQRVGAGRGHPRLTGPGPGRPRHGRVGAGAAGEAGAVGGVGGWRRAVPERHERDSRVGLRKVRER